MFEGEVELEAELENLAVDLSNAGLESEASPTSANLCSDLPEAPYSDELFEKFHKVVDIFEAVHASLEIFAPEIEALLGFAAGMGVAALGALAGILAGIAAPFLSIGAGYAEAGAKISKDRLRRGYAVGVVTGADGQIWTLVKERLWRSRPETNDFYPHGGVIAQRAFNLGLVAGFPCGRALARNPMKKKFFWHSIGATLSPGDITEFDNATQQFGRDPKSWPKPLWLDVYFREAASFTKLYLKD